MMPLGFSRGRELVEGKAIPMAIFTCTDCGDTLRTKINYGSMNPEAIAKRVRAAGWECHSHKASATRCPTCQTRRAHNARGDTPNKDTPVTTPKATLALVDREPTPDQRLKIRQKLDALFDDAAGSYLDGASDQKIGEDLNLPWAWVQKIREAAYGPIRVDPEVAKLKSDVAALQRAISAASADFEKRLNDLLARADALSRRA